MDQTEAFRRLRIAGILAIAAIAALAIVQGFLVHWRLAATLDIAGVLAALGILYAFVIRRAEAYAGSAMRKLEERRERFRSLFDHSPSAIVEIALDGSIRALNPRFEVMVGYRANELVGEHFSVLVTSGRIPLATARVDAMMTGSDRTFEGFILCKNGVEILLEITPIPIRVEGEIDGVFMGCRELTAERALSSARGKDDRLSGLYRLVSSTAEVSLMIDETLRFGSLALDLPYGFVTHLREGNLTILHRYGPGDLLPLGFQMPVTSAIGKRLASSPRALAIEDLTVEPYASELQARGLPWKSYIGSRIFVDNVLYGSLLFLSESVRPEPFRPSDLDFVDLMSGLIGASVAREIRQKQLEEFASNDALTGLPNRRTLETFVRRALMHARRTNDRLALHYIDLNGFKPINDRYGHAIGDELLCEVARRFSALLRGRDLLARVGGDEFVAVESTIGGDEAVAALVLRFTSALGEPIALSNGERVSISASYGSATYPENGQDFEALLKVADAAMFATKAARRAG